MLRFLLELAALGSFALWGSTVQDGPLRWLAAIGTPLVAAAVWGIFRVPDDPGPAPVAVPGFVRLSIELVFFFAAVLALYLAGHPIPALAFAALVVLHYAVGHRRIAWLLRER